MSTRTCELKKNALLYFEGNHYSNYNITDKVAVAILEASPANEKQFKLYPKGYKVKTEEAKLSSVKKRLAGAYEAVAKTKAEAEKAEADLVKKAEAVEVLAEHLAETVKVLEAADDDKKEAAGKVAKEAEKVHDKALEDLVEAEELVPGLKEKAEVAEADVVKYEALLAKRDK